jgi:hypothetical protein
VHRGTRLDASRAILHATLHANLEICGILAVLVKRKSLFPWIFGFPDHPHTVEVTASNPVLPNDLIE